MWNFKEMLRKYPNLDIGDRIGSTYYIDFIKITELTHPVMTGKDLFGRFFIVIKIIYGGKTFAQTFFQRYSGDFETSNCLMMGADVLDAPYFIETDGGMNEFQKNKIKDLVEKKFVCIDKETRFRTWYFKKSDDFIFLDCLKFLNAVLKIQKNWRKARYDPSYKLCEKTQLKNLQEVLDDCGVEMRI